MIYLYKIINHVTGKSYIGQAKNPADRWARHRKKGSGCVLLSRALQKYGKEAFEFSVLEGVETREQADEREAQLIAAHNTLVPAGYNIRAGGSAARNASCAKPVYALAVEGDTSWWFSSASEAKQFGFQPATISECCSGRRPSHGGFVWKFADSDSDLELIRAWKRSGLKRQHTHRKAFSEEHKAALSEARRQWWVRRKAKSAKPAAGGPGLNAGAAGPLAGLAGGALPPPAPGPLSAPPPAA